jgi:hypothetical protein
MNKEDKWDYVLTFPAFIKDYIPDLWLTPNVLVQIPGKRIVSFSMHHFASTLTVTHTTVAFPMNMNPTLSLVVPGLDTLCWSATYVSPFQTERSSCLTTTLCQLSGKSNTTQMYSAAKDFVITSTSSFKQD